MSSFAPGLLRQSTWPVNNKPGKNFCTHYSNYPNENVIVLKCFTLHLGKPYDAECSPHYFISSGVQY